MDEIGYRCRPECTYVYYLPIKAIPTHHPIVSTNLGFSRVKVTNSGDDVHPALCYQEGCAWRLPKSKRNPSNYCFSRCHGPAPRLLRSSPSAFQIPNADKFSSLLGFESPDERLKVITHGWRWRAKSRRCCSQSHQLVR